MNVPGWDRWIPCVRHNGGRSVNLRKPDCLREELSCGLDVEPEFAFREGLNEKENVKKLPIAILALSLTVAMSASASITYSGTALAGLDYSSYYAGDAQYVAGTPDVAQLYTADLSTADTADSPAVFFKAPVGTTLSTLSGSYALSAGTTVNPYWILYLTDDPTYSSPIVTTDGGLINGSSLVHVGNLINGSITLSALDALIDPLSGLAYGQETINWAGLEIGDGGSGAGTANIESITISSVPEPTTMLAGALLLLPFGASALRVLRKTRKV